MKYPPPINWRHQGDYKRDAEERAATDITCRDESLTMQSFTEDADLNVIAKRYGIDGQIPVAPINPAMYGDFSDAPDLREALDRTRDAKNKFMDLPAKLRARFRNDPSELWDFVNDPENWEEALRLGILAKPAPSTTKSDGATPAPPTTTTEDTPKGETP